MRDYATLGPGPVGSYEVVGMGGGCGVGRGGGGGPQGWEFALSLFTLSLIALLLFALSLKITLFKEQP